MAKAKLMEQDLSKLKIEELTPLTPEVISRQATINIGTIGHVAHGKSTVVKSISGVTTVRFKNELERNITIRLGYANAKIYKCSNGQHERPSSYASYGSDKEDSPVCEECGSPMDLQRHLSFVDCPGHDILMATMLNGAAVMDGALLLIAANEPCPQPQTQEHIAAVEIMGLRNIIIVQNKIDLVNEPQAKIQYTDIQNLVQGTHAQEAPIVPISAQMHYNVDVLCEYLVKKIPVPKRDFVSPPQMIVIRSFDVNKPGSDVDELKGGVAGGSIMQGVLKVGQEVEIRPGIISKDANGATRCVPILTQIVNLKADNNNLKYAVPGGLIGVETTIDPTLTRGDRLVGQVLGAKGYLPDVYIQIDVQFYLLKRLLGVKASDGQKQSKVNKLSPNEVLLLNIGTQSGGAKVSQVSGQTAKLLLTQPVCTKEKEKLAISRRIENHWRLIGWGKIQTGKKVEIAK